MLIDIHCHLVPKDWDDFRAEYGSGDWPRVKHLDPCSAQWLTGDRVFRNVTANSWDLEMRIAEMDKLGIAHQVVSPPPVMFCYWAEPSQGGKFCRMFNDALAAMCSPWPQRFSPMAIVPLQAPDMAIRELEHCRNQLGMKAVEIGTCPGGYDLDAPELDEFFSACATFDMSIFVHPGSPVLGEERLKRYYFKNLLGNPYEGAMAAASLVFGGVTRRRPELRFCIAHGGGAFSATLGRLTRGWEARTDAKVHLPCPPIEEFRKLYFDSLTYSAGQLRLLVEQVGARQIMVGTDYPFGLRETDPLMFLRNVGLDEPAFRAIAHENARRFLPNTIF